MPLPFKGFMYEMMSVMHGQGPNCTGRKEACSDMELNYVECLEAYGMANGGMKCAKFQEDLVECKAAKLRRARFHVMRQERFKKIAKGEIPIKERWGTPYPYDSFIQGTFFP